MRSFTNKIHLTTGSQNVNVIIPLFIKIVQPPIDEESNRFYNFIQVVREIERGGENVISLEIFHVINKRF